MKYISILIFFFGLILGPGYAVYCSNYSGDLVKEIEVFDQKVILNVNKNSRSALSFSSDLQEEHLINLDSSMNPLVLIGKFSYLESPPRVGLKKITNNFRVAKFIVSLHHEGEEVFSDNFGYRKHIKKKKDNQGKSTTGSDVNKLSFNQAFAPLIIDKSGVYNLNVKQRELKEIRLTNLSIELRRNVVIPNKRMLIIGYILCGFGFLFILFSFRKELIKGSTANQ